MDYQIKTADELETIMYNRSFCTRLNMIIETKDRQQVAENFNILDDLSSHAEPSASYKVIYTPQPIGHPNGMTETEVRLVYAAELHIRNLGLNIFYIVLSDADLSEAEFRQAVRSYLNRIVQTQKRADIPPTYIAVFEGTPQLHVNILFPLPVANKNKAIRRLSNSKHFGADGICVKSAKCDGWFTRYTAKERTHADRFIANISLCKRRPGHHPLGKLGGERVRLSKHLESQLIAQGWIAPRKKKKAKK